MKYNVCYQHIDQWHKDYLDGMTAQEWVDFARRINWLYASDDQIESDS